MAQNQKVCLSCLSFSLAYMALGYEEQLSAVSTGEIILLL